MDEACPVVRGVEQVARVLNYGEIRAKAAYAADDVAPVKDRSRCCPHMCGGCHLGVRHHGRPVKGTPPSDRDDAGTVVDNVLPVADDNLCGVSSKCGKPPLNRTWHELIVRIEKKQPFGAGFRNA